MNTVIAFPDAARQPARRTSRPDRGGSRPEGAEIGIRPVVRIERHVSALPGPTPEGEALFRPRRSY